MMETPWSLRGVSGSPWSLHVGPTDFMEPLRLETFWRPHDSVELTWMETPCNLHGRLLVASVGASC